MFQPHAHHVLWFLGTVLMLWAVSLVARGLFSRPPSVGGKRGPRVVRRGVVAGGMLLVVVSAGVMFCAAMFQKWMFGDDVVEEGFTVYHAVAIGIGVFAVSLAAWGWFADRSKGRQRCPKCWYEMDAVASTGKLICPECGHDARTAARLLKTQRSWKTVVIAGGLALVAAFTPRAALVQRDGWKALVPTTFMISAVWRLPDSWVVDASGNDRGTLEARIERGAHEWQKSWLDSKTRDEIKHPTSMSHLDRAIKLCPWSFGDDREVVLGLVAFSLESLGSREQDERQRASKLFETLRATSFTRPDDPDLIELCKKYSSETTRGLADGRIDVVLTAAMALAIAQTETDAMIEAIEPLCGSVTTAEGWLDLARPIVRALPAPRAERVLLEWVKANDIQQLGAWAAVVNRDHDPVPASIIREAGVQIKITTNLRVARALGLLLLKQRKDCQALIGDLAAEARNRGPRRAAVLNALITASDEMVAEQLQGIIQDAILDSDVWVVAVSMRWIRHRLNLSTPEVAYIVEIEHLLGHEDERVRSEAESLLIDLRHAQSRLGIPEIPEWLTRPVPSDVLE